MGMKEFGDYLNSLQIQKFSKVAVNGCCPKCGYAVMNRGTNAVTSTATFGIVAAVATGGIVGPSRKKIRCGGCGTRYLMG